MNEEPPKTKRIKRIKIPVTQKEIDEAMQGNSRKCMIQEALRRDHPEFKGIWVDKNQVRFSEPEQNVIYTFELSAFAKAMMLLWDNAEEIKPFDVWLRNPIVRERRLRNGHQRAKPNQDRARKHRGAIPNAKTEEARKHGGRDRIFGAKLWSDELAKLRKSLEPRTASPTAF